MTGKMAWRGLVATTRLILWDLDGVIGGVINVPGIPPEWLKELEEREQKMKREG